ncbi:MAG: MBL fold metallo-hydrolase [Chloroflexi bacterium]|nr:MBL fold metallo-hydrolase [Chloroflexota bacterium]
MKLTILGSSPACPHPESACSGYLIEDGTTSLIIDCGTGALASLRRHRDYHTLTSVVISHMHPDHFLDLIPLRQGLKYEPYTGERGHPRLFLPPGGSRALEGIAVALDSPASFFSDTFDLEEYDPNRPLRLGPFTLRFTAVPHYIPSYAIALEGSQKLAYSADTGPDERLVRLAADADLFLCEATLLAPEEDSLPRGHLAAREAGQIARRTGCRQLVVTHYWRSQDPERTFREAAEAFEGSIRLAQDNDQYEL